MILLDRSFTKSLIRVIKALKEFVARRGTPKMTISDNGKKFIATGKWLKMLVENNDLNDYLTDQRIEWRFNITRASWCGGFFERLIGFMKKALSKPLEEDFLPIQN